MKRFLSYAAIAVLVAGFVACGGDTNPQDDSLVDGQGEDLVEPVDAMDDNGQTDAVRDIHGDTSVDSDIVQADAPDVGPDGYEDADAVGTDIPDAGDAIDATDIDGDVCVGDLCGVPCDDDGLFCTEEVRNRLGECESRVMDSYCLIDGVCYLYMQPSEEDPCMACVPEVSQSGFSGATGASCEDGDPCTAGDTCDVDGVCQPGGGFGCNDDNPCTIDKCDARIGCVNTPRAATCDDGNACTYQDMCDTQTGICKGTNKTCNDGKVCTTDHCDPVVGCVYEAEDKACDDYNSCTVDDWCDADGNCGGTDKQCDDFNPCTLDSCAAGFCLHDWHYGACDDLNACTDNDFCNGYHVCAGTPKTSCDDYNPCTTDYCDEAVGCVHDYNSDPCEPASACEVDGVCTNGVCVGKPRDCEDGNLCTIDTCSKDNGCHHTVTAGVCDDHNACTINENCSSGICTPPEGPSGKTDCDDLNDCTADNCDPGIGCIHTPIDGECQDLNPCSLTGMGYCRGGECVSNLRDCNDNQPCTLDTCDGNGNCIHPPTIGACDDGDHCTTGETCQGGECTFGTEVNCDDTNVCTVDACNPDYGCVYTPTSGSCSDSDVCTINDLCSGGRCVGTPRVCEDYNVCTDNHCDKDSGCFFSPNSVTCNDYNVCTYDDVCGAGECHGVSVFNNPAAKGATLEYGKDGNLGNGVDVDDDPTTCSPKGYCIQGIDNAFSKLDWLFNTEMRDAAMDGSYAMLLEYEGLKTNGSQFTIKMYYGARVDPVTCDPTSSGCNYAVYPDSLQNGCDAVDIFDNATISGTKLKAGGATYSVPMNIIFEDYQAPLMMHRAKINATVSVESGKIVSGAGAIGGAIVFQDLLNALASIPEDKYTPRYKKDIVLSYVNMFLKPDIDLDGDGTDESISVGMRFSIVSGNLIGPL